MLGLHQFFTVHLGDFTPLLVQKKIKNLQLALLCLKVVTFQLPLNHSFSFSVRFRSGDWAGQNSRTFKRLNGMEHNVLLENLTLLENIVGNERSMFSSSIMVQGSIHVSFTNTNLPHSSFGKALSDHQYSSTKCYSGCETLWLVGSPSKH